MSEHTPNNLRQKPPSAEDHYFAREDRERIEHLRAERQKREAAEGAARLKEMHWMCCPKCGDKLAEVAHEGVLVDRCQQCRGVWFDASEFEALARKSEGGITAALLGWFTE